MRTTKILALDIETRPLLSYHWGLWNQNIQLNAVKEWGGMLCFGAKWLHDSKPVEFRSTHHDGCDVMRNRIWDLLNVADAVLHYNGARFDVPEINKELAEAGYEPYAPIRQIDLLKTIKARFRFASNKLAHIAPQLGLEDKVKNEGMPLWRRCLDGDETAWKRMRRYNIQDVKLLEQAYDEIQPWIVGHPSYGALEGRDVCPGCGSEHLERRGYAMLQTGRYPRFHCLDCSKWSRGTKADARTNIVEVAA